MTEQNLIDEYWMQQALDCAQMAWDAGEVPVGAVVVKDNELVSQAFNQTISLHDPSAHAEVLAIRRAGQMLKNYRLLGCTLYVTLEPCAMCSGMLVHSRIQRLVVGASDLKTGACGSALNLLQHSSMNHKIAFTRGILAEQCGQKLSDFFAYRRQQIKAKKQQQKVLDAETAANIMLK
ncbi:tRNA adenosine(34) deaminase TadA [Gayadomonas joobiniege]|uniref:tRNA adenosine(34) deaminase TadA n=1 Tax=Gayadomonas joobiniege TaxID=1234606 RepID=UPI000371DEAE|nr:tRNA adenosine(34) deaminase TadA [Gayadomonas joobiniege]